MNILIPMAGLGDRFKKQGYTVDKPMIPINGEPMIKKVLNALGIDGHYIFVINKNIRDIIYLKKILNEETKNKCTIIEIDYLTEGPASTCLLAKDLINNDEPLLITNCDQILHWDNKKFINFILNSTADGVVVTYNVKTKKNSYVKLDDNGYAVEFAEKKIISDHSLNGVHYWKKGKYFITSAQRMIEKNKRVNNEFYIAPTYNEMILEGKIIKTYEINNDDHWAVGTPEDLKRYLDYGNI